ncbi:hypothetical protein Pcinc_026194 [Petrolisthes cinctipes]|uniref:Uncharacterized protein n=1 Tax=Petrolisthes cinctipes TaxID=88211 RepID=A0AAE1F7T1_PETCI|nr:hypothetical protein Pcinc_026194 [Petrolisthes cinctipes]
MTDVAPQHHGGARACPTWVTLTDHGLLMKPPLCLQSPVSYYNSGDGPIEVTLHLRVHDGTLFGDPDGFELVVKKHCFDDSIDREEIIQMIVVMLGLDWYMGTGAM